MFFRTSGNKAETSLPIVIAAIVFCIASFLESIVTFCHMILKVRFTSHKRTGTPGHCATQTSHLKSRVSQIILVYYKRHTFLRDLKRPCNSSSCHLARRGCLNFVAPRIKPNLSKIS